MNFGRCEHVVTKKIRETAMRRCVKRFIVSAAGGAFCSWADLSRVNRRIQHLAKKVRRNPDHVISAGFFNDNENDK